MPKQQFDKFVSFVSRDRIPRQKASKSTPDLDEFVKTVQWYARENGYDFTEDEIKVWFANQRNQFAAGELGDSQLEAGSGGGNLNQYLHSAMTYIIGNMK